MVEAPRQGLQRRHPQEQGHRRTRRQVDRIGHRHPGLDARLTRIAQQPDALAGLHRLSGPVIGVGIDEHAISGRHYLQAREFRGQAGDLRLALAHPCLGLPDFGARLLSVEGALRGLQELGPGGRHRCPRHRQAAAQAGVVELGEHIALAHRGVGRHAHRADHAGLRRRDDLAFQ